jgi:hypothetical protein
VLTATSIFLASYRGYSTLAMRLTLYQRDDCHLCDLALDVLAQARAPEFSSVFIDDDAELEARYGERVPVLRNEDSGCELNWPFDAAAVMKFNGC